MAGKTPQETARAEEIGARIALARREADGMTQRELADLLGVTERSVAAYEAGEVIPYRFMRQLEQLLNRPANWILYGESSAAEDWQKAFAEITRKLDEILSQLPELQTSKQRRKTAA